MGNVVCAPSNSKIIREGLEIFTKKVAMMEDSRRCQQEQSLEKAGVVSKRNDLSRRCHNQESGDSRGAEASSSRNPEIQTGLEMHKRKLVVEPITNYKNIFAENLERVVPEMGRMVHHVGNVYVSQLPSGGRIVYLSDRPRNQVARRIGHLYISQNEMDYWTIHLSNNEGSLTLHLYKSSISKLWVVFPMTIFAEVRMIDSYMRERQYFSNAPENHYLTRYPEDPNMKTFYKTIKMSFIPKVVTRHMKLRHRSGRVCERDRILGRVLNGTLTRRKEVSRIGEEGDHPKGKYREILLSTFKWKEEEGEEGVIKEHENDQFDKESESLTIVHREEKITTIMGDFEDEVGK